MSTLQTTSDRTSKKAELLGDKSFESMKDRRRTSLSNVLSALPGAIRERRAFLQRNEKTAYEERVVKHLPHMTTCE
jgi:hypothetical protein